MYENQTASVIRDRILENTDINVYKGQGSHLYNSASAMGVVLQDVYIALDNIVVMSLISKSHGEFLDERLKEFNFHRKPGETAKGYVVIKGDTGTRIVNEMKIKANGLEFAVWAPEDYTIESQEGVRVQVECLTPGYEGNIPPGIEFEMDVYDSNIKEIKSDSVFVGGIDPEDDDELKDRFFYFKQHPATSGNVYHYEMWALEVNGVKRVKVYEKWKGPGTVKVVVYGDKNKTIDSSVLDQVKLNIEKNRPVCPEVTVVAATPVTVNITASIKTTDLDYAIDNFKSNLANYFLDVSEKISYSKLFGCLASCKDVVDVVDFKVNRGTSSVSITKDQVAILGEIQVKEAGD